MSAGFDGASSIRVPLDETTNVSVSTPSSPTSATAKTGPVPRRKPAHQDLNAHLDSSESYPSPHSSIYEASLVHLSSVEELKQKGREHDVPAHTTDDGPASWENIVVDASGNLVPASFLQSPTTKNAHIPHELYPITERSSLATLKASLRLQGQASTSTLRPHSPGLNGKKRKSFSLSNLPPTPERRSSLPPSPLPIPARPHLPPPERVPTPPGLPTFGKPEAINYRLPPPKTRFRDFFRSASIVAEQEYHRQTAGLPRGVVMRGENGVMVWGKFTPIVSGHHPPQRQVHRLFRAPNPADLTEPEVPEELEQASDGRGHTARARNGGNGAIPASENIPQRGLHWEPFKKYHEKKRKWVQNIFWFLFCCGCFCCLDEGPPPESPSSGIACRSVTENNVQPPSMRPRLTVPLPMNDLLGR
ncbi:hypothetical protein JMJ35_003862 [Cladonia borealis]|uniref:Uncharacterized protein n=1 Tax=Cladonia borealis TaxID=184061 RepID=A0AA39V912_9LECA|nr:hypothetical protein JMJ35_003862 [Cladonia borealis]